MRGAGEPVFEHDFPSGSDIIGDIRDGPKAAERMEFELFGRLAAHMELDQGCRHKFHINSPQFHAARTEPGFD